MRVSDFRLSIICLIIQRDQEKPGNIERLCGLRADHRTYRSYRSYGRQTGSQKLTRTNVGAMVPDVPGLGGALKMLTPPPPSANPLRVPRPQLTPSVSLPLPKRALRV